MYMSVDSYSKYFVISLIIPVNKICICIHVYTKEVDILQLDLPLKREAETLNWDVPPGFEVYPSIVNSFLTDRLEI